MPHNTPSESTVREEAIPADISTLQIVNVLLKKNNISSKFPSDGNDWSPRKCRRTLKGKAAAVACRDTLLPSFQHNYMLITSEEFENKRAAAFNEAFIAETTMKKHLKQLISSSIQALFHFQRQLRGEIGCHPVWVYKEAEKEIMAEVCAFFPHGNLIISNVWSDFEEHKTKKTPADISNRAF